MYVIFIIAFVSGGAAAGRVGGSHYVTAYSTRGRLTQHRAALTTHVQKYKTKTRRVHRRPVFRLKIASLSFVIITMLNILKALALNPFPKGKG